MAAKKLLDQNEVARMLGITPDEVASLRDRKKLFPYRDGDQWKFKQDDVEHYREELQAEREASGGAEATTDWKAPDDLGDLELQLNDDLDSILLSEVEMGNSSTEGASTIIGKPGDAAGPESDLLPAADPKKVDPKKGGKPTGGDISLAGDSGITLASEVGDKGGSTITLSGGQPASGGSSGFSLTGDSALTMGGDIPTKPGSTNKGSGFGLAADSGMSLMSDSDLSLASSDVKLVPGGSDAGKSGSDSSKKSGSSDKLFGSDALQLSDDELSLVDAPAPGKSKLGDAKRSGGSSIKLGDEELEVVLGGSGSDITQSPTDSGIQLISPSDSGLSLDQPIQMGSSARRLLDVEPSLESVEDIGIEPISDQKSDDDFLLTTGDEVGLQEESSDSGSQVIALDTDDELSSGMFGSAATASGLLEEDTASVATAGEAPVSLMGTPSLTTAPGMYATTPAAAAEAPYSGANIAILAVCVVLLMFCGMLTYDLMRNMWSWDGAYPVNSSIMDSIGNTVGWLEK
jgi:Helix-turn-helix domain